MGITETWNNYKKRRTEKAYIKKEREELEIQNREKAQQNAIRSKDPWGQRFTLFKAELNHGYDFIDDGDPQWGGFYSNKPYADSKVDEVSKREFTLDLFEGESNLFQNGKYLPLFIANGEVDTYAKRNGLTTEEVVTKIVKLMQKSNIKEYDRPDGTKQPYFGYQGLNRIRDNPEIFLEIARAIYTVDSYDGKTTTYRPLDEVKVDMTHLTQN
ncbi:MAG: hypothetical protein GOU98_00030 [Candidatus Altiarchaeota archaeon]|nr:hypothetical protein [Candidatus Altiarchaeota archaeon]